MATDAFGLRLKELREQAGLTQPQLAEKAGLSKGGLADLEQGRYKPSWEAVVALSAALGVDCTAFQVAPSPTVKPAGRGRPKAGKPIPTQTRVRRTGRKMPTKPRRPPAGDTNH